ncbi:unnamed protein product [Bursaphelenchus okinawaensis]|uniref:Peptidase A1 domain-containing protein n=1 Tax=Bursaphelenchus okinawaensis TaxID=465554 RepID=A0A811KBW6_9BILA|nr:unnamed protein product [Bursaphelenchus okinawaensis]CAG9097712.1 unnamed protein product [Bursaphelenchus okinawaensis]
MFPFKLVTFLLLGSPVFSYNVTNFYATVRLNDNPKLDRDIIIDTTSHQSFLMQNTVASPKRGVDFRSSKTFKNIDQRFSSQYSNGRITVNGAVGEDEIHVGPKVFRSQFGIFEKSNGQNPADAFTGTQTVGVLGLSRKPADNVLRDNLLNQYDDKTVCVSSIKYKDRASPYTTIGKPAVNPVTTVKSVDNSEGLWEVKLDFVKLACFHQNNPENAIISTATEELTVPEAYFEFITEVLGSRYDEKYGTYICSCERTAPFRFGINGEVFDVPIHDYITKIEGNICALKVNVVKNNEKFVLGARFLLENGVCLNFKKNTVTLFKPNERKSDLKPMEMKLRADRV